MNIELIKIEKSRKEKLENLMQLYLHDLSLCFPIEFDFDKCKYIYDLDSYFLNNFGYFIKKDNNIVGFILIDKNKTGFEVSEIFVINNFKRQSIGEIAVNKIFEMYKGDWVVKAVPLSKKAENFWIKVIGKYTKDSYRLEHTGKYNRAEFYFNND